MYNKKQVRKHHEELLKLIDELCEWSEDKYNKWINLDELVEATGQEKRGLSVMVSFLRRTFPKLIETKLGVYKSEASNKWFQPTIDGRKLLNFIWSVKNEV